MFQPRVQNMRRERNTLKFRFNYSYQKWGFEYFLGLQLSLIATANIHVVKSITALVERNGGCTQRGCVQLAFITSDGVIKVTTPSPSFCFRPHLRLEKWRDRGGTQVNQKASREQRCGPTVIVLRSTSTNFSRERVSFL